MAEEEAPLTVESLGTDDPVELRKMADNYRKGIGCEADPAKAMDIDRIAAQLDPSYYPALYDRLLKRFHGTDPDELRRICLERAGIDKNIRYRLALCMIHGYFLDRSLNEGMALLEDLAREQRRYLEPYARTVLSMKLVEHYDTLYEMLTTEEECPLPYYLYRCHSLGIGTKVDKRKAQKALKTIWEEYPIEYYDLLKEIDGEKAIRFAKDNLKKFPEYDAVIAEYMYDNGMLDDETVKRMRTGACILKKWQKENILRIAGMENGLEWKYDVYAAFADRTDNETKLKVFHRFHSTDENVLMIQRALTEKMVEFSEVCEKAGLFMELISGGLLGLVRHGGFVPWDDDLDTIMFEDDIPLLEYYLAKNKTSFHIFPARIGVHYKLRDFYTKVAIGIFPIESVLHYVNRTVTVKHRPTEQDLEKYGKPLCITYRLTRDSFKEKQFCFEEDVLFPMRKARFEGVEVPVPNNPESLLSQFYGNFYGIPTSNNRVHITEALSKDIVERIEKRRNGTCNPFMEMYDIARKYTNNRKFELAVLWAEKLKDYADREIKTILESEPIDKTNVRDVIKNIKEFLRAQGAE